MPVSQKFAIASDKLVKRRMVQIPPYLVPSVIRITEIMGYERDSTSIRNCIRASLNIIEKNPVDFLALLNNDVA